MNATAVKKRKKSKKAKVVERSWGTVTQLPGPAIELTLTPCPQALEIICGTGQKRGAAWVEMFVKLFQSMLQSES